MKVDKKGDGFTSCTNQNFGDPIRGTRKNCFCETSSFVEHKPFIFEAENADPYYQFNVHKGNGV